MNTYQQREYQEITDIYDPRKVQELFSIIPASVRTIIDIGCGNGLITNELNKRFDVLGVDVNASKLQYVHGKKLQAACDEIPRPDHSFDLVFSSEMLEHLPDDVFERTLKEFERLAKDYILITVPNNEDLDKLLVHCENCGKNYHKNGHLRSFTLNSFKGRISGFEPIDERLYGKRVRKYSPLLAKLKHSLTPPRSWIPSHWVNTMGVSYHF